MWFSAPHRPPPYVRVHTPTGFAPSVEDLADTDVYRIGKERLHARALHGPGIAEGGLEVRPLATAQEGFLGVEVAPGVAVHACGDDAYAAPLDGNGEPERWHASCKLSRLTLPVVLFVGITRVDEPTWFAVVNSVGGRWKPFKRVRETARLFLQPELPSEALELARVLVTAEVRALSLPADPTRPGPGELDTRHARPLGTAGCGLAPADLLRYRRALAALRRAATDVLRRRGLEAARGPRRHVIMLQLLAETGLIRSRRAVPEALGALADALPEVLRALAPGADPAEAAAIDDLHARLPRLARHLERARTAEWDAHTELAAALRELHLLGVRLLRLSRRQVDDDEVAA